MYGIVDEKGKVYSKAKKLHKLNEIFPKVEHWYPSRKLIITHVDEDAVCIGDNKQKGKQ